MKAKDLKQLYVKFFESKGHKIIPSASLIPENDPTVLFTTAGMHPLVPFLMGEKHPLGTRLTNAQKCIRTGDIDETGDTTHHTFFEMMGNWSLGDYFKKEAIRWSFEFLTGKEWLNLDINRIAVSVFAGDDDCPFDEEAFDIWKDLGIPESRIAKLPKKNNWWGPAGKTGPCGPDTEMFYWVDNTTPPPASFNDDDDRWVEIWNDVFMQYEKVEASNILILDNPKVLNIILSSLAELLIPITRCNIILDEKSKINNENILDFTILNNKDELDKWLVAQLLDKDYDNLIIVSDDKNRWENFATSLKKAILPYSILNNDKQVLKIDDNILYKFIPLQQQNVDTGLGLERVTAVLQGLNDNYKTERFWPIIELLQELSHKTYEDETKAMRIIADHMRAAVFILGDPRGFKPSNVDQGYILRRFIRRAIRLLHTLGIQESACETIAKKIIDIYKEEYSELAERSTFILTELRLEEEKFSNTLVNGMKEFERIASKMLEHGGTEISGKVAFLLFQSYGFPLEMTEELATEKNMTINKNDFNKAFEKHQELSRIGAEQKFKGGLSESSDITKKYHTATHILNAALKKVLNNPNIKQKGSNITPERMRFDFNFERPLTDEEKKAVEDEVNSIITQSLPIVRKEMPLKEAMQSGAESEFGAKYPETVSVYVIGTDEKYYSKEICMGPHVENTKDIGTFKIKKEQSSAAGIRRIKAVIE